MPALTNLELKAIASELQPLVGAQLQEVVQTETEFGVAFYHRQDMHWLWFDLDPREPQVLYFESDPPVRTKMTKPLVLFTRAHLVGHRLKAVEIDESLGRVLRISMTSPPGEDRTIEARLFPHGQNVLISAGEKTISWAKPKEVSEPPLETNEPEPREWTEIRKAWLKKRGLGPKEEKQSVESVADRAKRLFEKNLQKKTQALAKIEEDIQSKLDPKWREMGEWLKTNGALDVPKALRDVVDPKKSLSWNIENAFAKAKANERKIEGSRKRLQLLEKEIAELKKRGPQASAAQPPNKAKTLLEKADVRGRKFSLSDDIEAYIGKNAADNLALLRRAQPHDLWLHLRDYPGSHAIVRRPKNRKVNDNELNEIGNWVVIQSLKKNENELKGGKYDMLVVECRFVKPIKGDKLGRVTYQNDRLFVVRV